MKKLTKSNNFCQNIWLKATHYASALVTLIGIEAVDVVVDWSLWDEAIATFIRLYLEKNLRTSLKTFPAGSKKRLRTAERKKIR